MDTINMRFPTIAQQISLFILLGIFLGVTNNANAGSMICELEIETVAHTLPNGNITNDRVAEELSFETYLYDPAIEQLWVDLFDTMPNTSPDDNVVLQEDMLVTWPAGTLEMAGSMKMKVKTDKHSGLKEIKIKQVDSDEGITEFVAGTGGVNPNIAAGGWHEVEVESMDNVTVTIDGTDVTGFLKELEIELDESNTATPPKVKEFELKLMAQTNLPDMKKSFVSSVVVMVPATTVTAVGGTSYEEETDEEPVLLGGHIEAEYERDEDTTMEGVLINSLVDGNNNLLKEREGPCTTGSASFPPAPTLPPIPPVITPPAPTLPPIPPVITPPPAPPIGGMPPLI